VSQTTAAQRGAELKEQNGDAETRFGKFGRWPDTAQFADRFA
jgi:hypothetical protein